MEKDHVVISLEKYESLKSAVKEAEEVVENTKKQNDVLKKILFDIIKKGVGITFTPHQGEDNMQMLFTYAGYTITFELPAGQFLRVGRGDKLIELTVK